MPPVAWTRSACSAASVVLPMPGSPDSTTEAVVAARAPRSTPPRGGRSARPARRPGWAAARCAHPRFAAPASSSAGVAGPAGRSTYARSSPPGPRPPRARGRPAARGRPSSRSMPRGSRSRRPPPSPAASARSRAAPECRPASMSTSPVASEARAPPAAGMPAMRRSAASTASAARWNATSTVAVASSGTATSSGSAAMPARPCAGAVRRHGVRRGDVEAQDRQALRHPATLGPATP